MILKKHSCHATADSEMDYTLVTVLNLILAWTVHQHDRDPDIIFVPNDAILTDSSELQGATKQKPDIISVPLHVFRLWIAPEHHEKGFEELRVLLTGKDLRLSQVQRSWSDVVQFMEVNRQQAILNANFLDRKYSRLDLTKITFGTLCALACMLTLYTADFFIGSQSTQATSTDNGPTDEARDSRGATSKGIRFLYFNSRNTDNQSLVVADSHKRKTDGTPASNNKKARTGMSQTSACIPVEPLEYKDTPPPEVQIGFYGIERLRSSWQLTHAMGIYLSGMRYCCSLINC